MATAFSKSYSVLGTSLSHSGVFAHHYPKRCAMVHRERGMPHSSSYFPDHTDTHKKQPSCQPCGRGSGGHPRAQGGSGCLESEAQRHTTTASNWRLSRQPAYNFMLGCIFRCCPTEDIVKCLALECTLGRCQTCLSHNLRAE